jgi:hypothetical protein
LTGRATPGLNTPRTAGAAWRAALMALALVISPAARLSSQAMTISTAGGALRVHAPAFAFLQGEVLDRLRDGRSVRIDLELRVLARADGPAQTQDRESFNVSFDLWEERFAVTRLGSPTQAISHLTARAAEAWCLGHLAVPLAELGGLGRDAPIWLRLESRAEAPTDAAVAAASGFSLRRLIDSFSRRPEGELRTSIDAGPLRLP